MLVSIVYLFHMLYDVKYSNYVKLWFRQEKSSLDVFSPSFVNGLTGFPFFFVSLF